MGAEERWGNGAALTIIQLSAHSFPCGEGGDGAPWLVDGSLADTDLTASAVNRREMRIGGWRIRIKSDSLDFHLDSDGLMRCSWILIWASRVEEDVL